jgi:hypothetical protein
MTRAPVSNGPIHIGGLDRSGKTTMAAFLTSHARIAVPGVGSNMWTYFFERFGDLADPANLEACLEAMLRYSHIRALQPDAERIRREFRQAAPSYGRLFSLFLAHYAEREGKPRWGDQTGLIERYADQVFAAYPDAKIVHLVRDPRDRYEASLTLWPEGRGRAGGATARWRYSIALAERNVHRYRDAYLIVRFEDLVLRTELTLRRVCGFLGESFEPEMLTMPGAPDRRDRLASRARRTVNGSPLSGEFVGRFRGRVPPSEVAFLQAHARRPMRTYGYPPDRLSLSPREWLHFGLLTYPSQLTRMLGWRAVEELRQRFPASLGAQPDRRTIVNPARGAAA